MKTIARPLRVRSSLEEYFQGLKRRRAAAFMPYVTAGYPSRHAMHGILGMLAANGADCVELGLPFSDPIADGVTIQDASQRALDQGATFDQVMRQAEYAARLGLRVVLMSYANLLIQERLPTLRHRRDRLGAAQTALHATARRLSGAGVQGLIVPDLPLEEAAAWAPICAGAGIALTLFAAPTTPLKRLAMVGRLSHAFIYYVSLTGVTGERAALPRGLATRLRTVQRVVRMPVCVGFGVSTPVQAALVAKWAQGVIVGSALVRRLAGWGQGTGTRREIGRWVRSVAAAVHGRGKIELETGSAGSGGGHRCV